MSVSEAYSDDFKRDSEYGTIPIPYILCLMLFFFLSLYNPANTIKLASRHKQLEPGKRTNYEKNSCIFF